MTFHPQLPEQSRLGNPYLQYVANLDLPLKEKLELICIAGSILSYFVDQAFGVQTDQITLQSLRKIHFSAPLGHATIENHPGNQTADARSNGAESDSNPLGPIEP